MRPLSVRNPRIQRLGRLVKRRSERIEQRAFVVEGPVLLRAAMDAGAAITEVYVDEAALTSPPVAEVLDRVDETLADVWVLDPGHLDRIGDAKTSQGVLAVVDRLEPERPPTTDQSFALVLVDIGDPGNVGTLIRAGVAAGASAVMVVGGVDPTNPKVVRASAGAIFLVPVVERDDADADTALAELRDDGFRLVGTVVRDGAPHTEVDLTGPIAVVLGNEAHGLPESLVDELDASVTIEMAGPTESLNVAMAGTIMAFEVLRRR